MKIEDIKGRIDEVIALADKTLKNGYNDFGTYFNSQDFYEFRSTSLSFLQNLFTESHPFYKEFDIKVSRAGPNDTQRGKGILKAAKQEIDNGWLFTFKAIVSAEIFSDFLDMAEYLLKESYKDAAAIMIGSVLEEHLRQLCIKNNLSIELVKDEISKPKKADSLNSDLAAAKVYNKLDQKSITSWLDLRNNAAHGKYEEYSKEQVNLMYGGVTNFISRTS